MDLPMMTKLKELEAESSRLKKMYAEELLTEDKKNWGFGLCFLYLRNIKGFKWNHKRVYRIYKELELNMRIKPRRRLV